MCTFILIIMVFLSAALKGQYDVGLIGFALVYTLSLSGLAQWSVRQSAEVENQMTAMERINTYAHLPAEEGYFSQYKYSKGGGEGEIQSGLNKKEDEVITTAAKSTPSITTPVITSPSSSDPPPEEVFDTVELTDCELVSDDKIKHTEQGKGETVYSNIVGAGGGTIDIRGLSVTYREDLPPVLKDLNIHIWGGCKAGIVGRTGSGEWTGEYRRWQEERR